MNIRRANAKDIESIMNLLSSVLEIHAKLRPDIFISGKTKYTHDELANMIKNNANPIFVADIDGLTAGYIFCESKNNPITNNTLESKELYIDDLCVDEKYRGKGVSEALLQYVKRYAKENNFDCITLNVWAGNERAERFYEKQGFFKRKTMMEITLGNL